MVCYLTSNTQYSEEGLSKMFTKKFDQSLVVFMLSCTLVHEFYPPPLGYNKI